MVNRRLAWAVCGAGVLVLALMANARAMDVNMRTYLTFSQPVALPGVSLGSGTYIFEFADRIGAPDVVRVLSADHKIAVYMGFTRAIDRPNNVRHTQSVSLGESTAGVAPPVTAWWPTGESVGRQFIYRDR